MNHEENKESCSSISNQSSHPPFVVNCLKAVRGVQRVDEFMESGFKQLKKRQYDEVEWDDMLTAIKNLPADDWFKLGLDRDENWSWEKLEPLVTERNTKNNLAIAKKRLDRAQDDAFEAILSKDAEFKDYMNMDADLRTDIEKAFGANFTPKKLQVFVL